MGPFHLFFFYSLLLFGLLLPFVFHVTLPPPLSATLSPTPASIHAPRAADPVAGNFQGRYCFSHSTDEAVYKNLATRTVIRHTSGWFRWSTDTTSLPPLSPSAPPSPHFQSHTLHRLIVFAVPIIFSPFDHAQASTGSLHLRRDSEFVDLCPECYVPMSSSNPVLYLLRIPSQVSRHHPFDRGRFDPSEKRTGRFVRRRVQLLDRQCGHFALPILALRPFASTCVSPSFTVDCQQQQGVSGTHSLAVVLLRLPVISLASSVFCSVRWAGFGCCFYQSDDRSYPNNHVAYTSGIWDTRWWSTSCCLLLSPHVLGLWVNPSPFGTSGAPIWLIVEPFWVRRVSRHHPFDRGRSDPSEKRTGRFVRRCFQLLDRQCGHFALPILALRPCASTCAPPSFTVDCQQQQGVSGTHSLAVVLLRSPVISLASSVFCSVRWAGFGCCFYQSDDRSYPNNHVAYTSGIWDARWWSTSRGLLLSPHVLGLWVNPLPSGTSGAPIWLIVEPFWVSRVFRFLGWWAGFGRCFARDDRSCPNTIAVHISSGIWEGGCLFPVLSWWHNAGRLDLDLTPVDCFGRFLVVPRWSVTNSVCSAVKSFPDVVVAYTSNGEGWQAIGYRPLDPPQQLGRQGQALLLFEEGILQHLEDQYWDVANNLPRSHFSDDLQVDHEQKDGGIVIVSRPLDNPFPMDSDKVTHASFDTMGCSRPAPPAPPAAAYTTQPPPLTLPPQVWVRVRHCLARTITLNPPPQADSLRPPLRQSRLSEFFPGPRRHQHQPQHDSNSRSLRNAAPRIPSPPPPQHLSPAQGTRGQISAVPPPQPIPTEASAATPHLHSPSMHFNSVALSNLPSPRSRRSSNHLASSQLSSHFGDPWPRPKSHRHIRISFSNINGFDTDTHHNSSVSHLRHWLQETCTDIFLGCEPKINWSKMPWDGQLASWFRTGEALRTVAGYNIHEAAVNDRRQFGGTFALVFGEPASHVLETGHDSSGLGRWSWLRFGTRHSTLPCTRVVVACRPVKQQRSQLLSTYMQHSRYLAGNRDFICPRRAFFRDLDRELSTWITLGDRIIVAGDFNDPVNQRPILQFFSRHQMRDVLSEQHPLSSPTSTHTRGSTVIDAIWASNSLPIEAGTWLSFDLSVADHRSIIIDVDARALLGSLPLRVARPQGRRLNSRLPPVRATYNRLLEHFLDAARFKQKAHVLCHHNWSTLPLSSLHAHLEQMDRIRTEGMKFAEARCRRFHSGAVFFSPSLNSARQLRNLYRLVIQKLTGRTRSRSRITKLAKRCGIVDIRQLSVAEARRRFALADAHYRSLKPRSAELREVFLRHRLEDPTTSPSTQKAVLSLLRNEQLRTAYRYLKFIEGGGQTGASVAEVQEQRGSLLFTHRSRQNVESVLTDALSSRFCLASTTPLLQPNVVNRLGVLGWTPSTQAILQGTFDYDSLPLPEATQRFLQGLSLRDDPLPLVSTSISSTDFRSYWRHVREDTSSSFSGLHFGHYKAATYSPLLSEMHALLTESAFCFGYPLRRWRHGLQVILEKSPGVRLVNKLRAILLMEADFNFGNKLFVGHRMMLNALNKPTTIPPELYGGIKGKRANHLALTRCLFTDIIRQKRRPAALASVDAESCYDRISHTAASLACQRWGVPAPVMVTMLRAIQQMRFHLRTAFGDSETFYSSDDSRLFQGICQGNGAGPAVWLAISANLVQILNTEFPCTPLRAPLSPDSPSLSLSGLLFVDDTDLLVVADTPSTEPAVVIEQLQRRINFWVDLLHASGGAISVAKSSWSLLSFLPREPTLRFHNSLSAPGILTLRSPSNLSASPQAIKRLEPWESHTVVGVVQSPNGSMKGQLRSLRRKANQWAASLSRHTLPRHLAWIALRSKIWASLRYPLLCTTLTKKEGHFVVSGLYNRVLPQLGAMRSLPNAYKYGPARCQGLGLPHPYFFQGGTQLSTFVHLFRSQTPEGNAIRISGEQVQLQLGTDIAFLNLSFRQWGFLADPCWLTCLWQFVSDNGFVVEGLPPIFPRLPRLHDRYLMAALLADGRLPRSVLLACNRVRLGLHLLSVSDIATGQGDRIRRRFLSSLPPAPVASTYEWPPSPFSPRDLRLWIDSIVLVFGEILYTPLGAWVNNPHVLHWEWWSDPTSAEFLYRFQPPSFWSRFQLREGRRTRRLTYRLHSALPATFSPPSIFRRATTHPITDTTVGFEGCSLALPFLPRQDMAHSIIAPSFPYLTDYLSTLPDRLYWPLHQSLFPFNGAVLAQSLLNGTAMGVCDGSYMPCQDAGRATAAWVLVDSHRPHLQSCFGHTLVSGNPAVINSYRAELHGLHTILMAVDLLCAYHDIRAGSIRLYCDNLQAVNRAKLSPDRLSHKMTNLDLLRAICHLRMSLPISVSITHVTGHQDSSCLPEDLPLEARLNILCDSRAKSHLLDCIRLQHTPPGDAAIHQEGLRVLFQGHKLYTDVSKAAQEQAAANDFRTFALTKNHFTEASFHLVNWDAIELVFRALPDAFRLWAVKFVSGFSGTAVHMHRWKLWPSPLCPCCGLVPETTSHLLSCTAPALIQARESGLERIATWMTDWSTHPHLQTVLLVFFCQAAPTFPSHLGLSPNSALPLAFAQQIAVGTINFWFGRHIRLWEDFQTVHYASLSQHRRTGRAWAAGLIQVTLEFCHSLWKARNAIVHDRHLRGLDLFEASHLEASIRAQFASGPTGLLRSDLHLLLSRSLEEILALPGDQQHLWMRSILLARDLGEESLQPARRHMSSTLRQWLGL